MNRANLLKAADGIEGIDPELFNMNFYRAKSTENVGIYPTKFVNKNDCGTVGCALGWCPLIKGLETVNDDYIGNDVCSYTNHRTLSFDLYNRRIFGISLASWAWSYMFDSQWAIYNNTPAGAANRIREIANGKQLTKDDFPWNRK